MYFIHCKREDSVMYGFPKTESLENNTQDSNKNEEQHKDDLENILVPWKRTPIT